MKRIILIYLFFASSLSFAQKIEGTEIGFDGFFGASTFGVSYGIGPKFGFVMNENLILGPSIRYQRTWANNLAGQKASYNNFGGGFFLHGRYKNVIFGGAELEVLKTSNTFIDTSAVFKKIVPTLFICAGFSKEFNGIVRINVGAYYDVINSKNSPFRQAYFLTTKDVNGQIVKYIPLIYRISFFFPLTHNKKQSKSKKTEKEPVEETW
jgi:hypothetical protein